MKQGLFTWMNYLLPKRGALPLNSGEQGAGWCQQMGGQAGRLFRVWSAG